MIAARALAFVLIFVSPVISFRSPDNLPNNVNLPTIPVQPKVAVSPPTDSAKTLQPVKDPLERKPSNAVVRKKWGVDNSHDSDYWYK
jgi:hypothetical protein